MTKLNDQEHEAQMQDMKSFDEEMPSIGIFWYDPADKSLFGVYKSELTPKMVEEAAEKDIARIEYTHRPLREIREGLPRGRVAWNIDKFIVLVGHWAEPIQTELNALIEAEFHLPYFEFVYDELSDEA